MKALTLEPDWGMLMLQGEKTVEYRTWKTNYRGDILICTSAKHIRGCISGHALLIANLVDCVLFDETYLDAAAMDEMPDGGYAWIFDHFRVIQPFPVKGRLGLFNIENPDIKIAPSDISDAEAESFVDEFIRPLIFQPVQP